MTTPGRKAADLPGRLTWLLRTIPRRAGDVGPFHLEDLIGALAVGARDHPERSQADAVANARAWLSAIRGGVADVTTPRSLRYLAVLEDVFRLPAGYFHDEQTQLATDERIAFAAEAAGRGVTVIGPCRVRNPLSPVAGLHALHQRARATADQRSGR